MCARSLKAFGGGNRAVSVESVMRSTISLAREPFQAPPRPSKELEARLDLRLRAALQRSQELGAFRGGRSVPIGAGVREPNRAQGQERPPALGLLRAHVKSRRLAIRRQVLQRDPCELALERVGRTHRRE